MRFIRRLFQSQHIKDCRRALARLSAEFEGEFAWEILRSEIEKILLEVPGKLEDRIALDGETALQVVEDLTANLALIEIESGKYHTYRGVLSMQGTSLRAVFAKITTRQFAAGYISAEELGTANENIKRAIKEAG